MKRIVIERAPVLHHLSVYSVLAYHRCRRYCARQGSLFITIWRRLRSRYVALRILCVYARWRRAISFTLRLLYSWENRLWYLLDRRLSGRQSRSERGGKDKTIFATSSKRIPVMHTVARRFFMTEPSRLIGEPGLGTFLKGGSRLHQNCLHRIWLRGTAASCMTSR